MKTVIFLITIHFILSLQTNAQVIDSSICVKNVYFLKSDATNTKGKRTVRLMSYRDSVFKLLSEKTTNIISHNDYALYKQNKILSSLKLPDTIKWSSKMNDLTNDLLNLSKRIIVRQKKLESIEVYDMDNFVISRTEYKGASGCNFSFKDGPVDDKYLHYTDETYGSYQTRLSTGKYVLCEIFSGRISYIVPVISHRKIIGFMNLTYRS